MSNDVKHALGNAPNSEYILDAEGRIFALRGWSDPTATREDFERLLGQVENPTTIADLNLPSNPPPKIAPRGIVPRIDRPRNMIAIRYEAQVGFRTDPIYAKLRAEAEPELLRNGTGKLYLGFFPDPIYGVHWNNLVDPIRYEIKAPNGITVSPAQGEGPRIEESSDVDPREFLIEIEGAQPGQKLELEVRYFGCNDEEGWCKAVSESYTLLLEGDPDGGRPRPPASNNRPNQRRGRGNAPPEFVIRRFDQNQNGQLDPEERPAIMQFFDTNKDGRMTPRERQSGIRKIMQENR